MRQALGRGLDALIPNIQEKKPGTDIPEVEVRKIPISSIRPNRLQPRKNFDAEKLSGLAQSIKENGLAQPVLVSYDNATNTYELIAGERRLRASQLAGKTEIEAVVRNPASDQQRLALALIENLQREDLNPIEEALGYLHLMKDFGMSQTHLSDNLGKSKSTISNTLRLLELPEEVQNAVQMNQITEGHARALLTIKNKPELIKLFHLTINRQLSVRDVEDYARKIEAGKKISDRNLEAPKKQADIRALEESLQQKLGTRVEIKTKKNISRGTVVIHYYNLTDFDNIIKMLKK